MNDKKIFDLKDLRYEITMSVIEAEYINSEIILKLEVKVGIYNKKINEYLEEILFNHTFNTHVSSVKELRDEKFIWDNVYNDISIGCSNTWESAESYGDVEFLEKGTIEIVDIKENTMAIKWYGFADSVLGKEFVTAVSFDTIFYVNFEVSKDYTINAYKSSKTKNDNNTQLEILNSEEFENELVKLSKSKKRSKFSNILKKYEFNAVLKFKLVFNNKDYFGEVIFINETTKHVTNFDSSCPIKVSFLYISWNLKTKHELLKFKVEDKA